MTPIGTLWGTLRQPQTKVILSVAALNGLEVENPEWTHLKKPTEFTDKFSYGKIPAYEGLDGFKLIEGAPIARYLCGLGTKINLMGSSLKELALIDQWIHFSEQEIGGPNYSIAGMIYGFGGQFDREVFDKQLERLVRALTYVESYLATRPSGYLVSDSVTLADFFLAGQAYGVAHGTLGAAERAQYPSLYAHYAKVTSDERVKHLWSTKEFVDVAIKEPRSLPTS